MAPLAIFFIISHLLVLVLKMNDFNNFQSNCNFFEVLHELTVTWKEFWARLPVCMHSYCRRVPFTTLQKCFPEINKKFIEIHKTFFQLAEKFSCIRNKVPWVKTGTNYILHFLFCMKKDLMNFGKYLRVPSIVWPKDSNLVTYKISRVYAPKQKHSHQFTTFSRWATLCVGP